MVVNNKRFGPRYVQDILAIPPSRNQTWVTGSDGERISSSTSLCTVLKQIPST